MLAPRCLGRLPHSGKPQGQQEGNGMSRTLGYYVKLERQGSSHAEERTRNEPDYIMEGNKPRLFTTAALAFETGEEYTQDKPDLTFTLEPATL
jgi:hypothetical protein